MNPECLLLVHVNRTLEIELQSNDGANETIPVAVLTIVSDYSLLRMVVVARPVEVAAVPTVMMVAAVVVVYDFERLTTLISMLAISLTLIYYSHYSIHLFRFRFE